MIKNSNSGHQKTPVREWKGKSEWEEIWARLISEIYKELFTNQYEKHRQPNGEKLEKALHIGKYQYSINIKSVQSYSSKDI